MTMSNTGLWKQLLAESPAGSILMGGAVVDALLEIEPKDYDIFHPYSIGMPIVPAHWKYKPRNFFIKEPQYNNDNNLVGSVYNYDVNGLKIQLVGVHLPNAKDYFKYFDHSLTFGRYNVNGLFYHQRLFDALDSKTVRCFAKTNKAKSLQRAISKVKKFDPEGFADWKFIDFDE